MQNQYFWHYLVFKTGQILENLLHIILSMAQFSNFYGEKIPNMFWENAKILSFSNRLKELIKSAPRLRAIISAH